MIFTLTGMNQVPQVAYAARLREDPLGTIRYPIQTPILNEFSYNGGVFPIGDGFGLVNWWGSIASLRLDPVDGKTFYGFHENPSQLASDVDLESRISYAWTTALFSFSLPCKSIRSGCLCSSEKIKQDSKKPKHSQRDQQTRNQTNNTLLPLHLKPAAIKLETLQRHLLEKKQQNTTRERLFICYSEKNGSSD